MLLQPLHINSNINISVNERIADDGRHLPALCGAPHAWKKSSALQLSEAARLQDIFALFHLGKDFKFVSKPEIFKIPFVGWSMWLTGAPSHPLPTTPAVRVARVATFHAPVATFHAPVLTLNSPLAPPQTTSSLPGPGCRQDTSNLTVPPRAAC